MAADAFFPTPLDAYPPVGPAGLIAALVDRAALDPFNMVATGIFVLALVHTFSAATIADAAHDYQARHDARARAEGREPRPSVTAGLLHFAGEIEVVFGLWAAVLLVVATLLRGWSAAVHYVNDTVNYTEPLFVVVIMALAATRPIIGLAEAALGRVAAIGGGTVAASWVSILTVGPLLGSFVTEPAAMTISALLLSRQFYDLEPSRRLKYATLGLLFVNISVGGTLTHFAAPPVLMVARAWDWNTPFMLTHLGWRAVLSIAASTAVYFVLFRTELRELSSRERVIDLERPDEDAVSGGLFPVPAWVTAAHAGFMAWTVVTAHYPALFLGGFLFFIGFVRATSAYQSQVALRSPMLVGFFLAALVIHGGLQGWWIAPTLASLSEAPLFVGAGLLTAFNDNALITYLATLVPNLGESMKLAVVEGAVVGGGLTVIANAPNPAGQALLARFFGGAIHPLGLLAAAVVPTLIAALLFRAL